MKAKCNQRWLGGAKTVSPVSSLFLNEGGKFLGAENVPHPRFLKFGAGVARPGELTCQIFFFYGKHNHAPPPLQVSVCLLEPT